MAKTALLISQRPSDYVEMKRCALALAQRGFRIQFLYHCIYEDSKTDLPILEEITALRKSGVISEARTIVEGPPTKTRRGYLPTQPDAEVDWWKRRLLRPVMRNRIINLFVNAVNIPLRQLYIIVLYRLRLRRYVEILEAFRPDIIILPEDVVGLVSPQMVRAGHLKDIPSLIVPYTIANQQEAFRSLRHYPNLNYYRWFNWPLAIWTPSWVLRQDSQAVIRLPIMQIFGHLFMRTSPPDPWMMNSGYANAIAVENESMRDYYASAGIPASKMRVVGAIYDDFLARLLMDKPVELAAIRKTLGIASDKPLLVIGGCPDQSGSCPAFEFKDMQEFAQKLAEVVKPLANDYEIVVRPHPNYLQFGEMVEAHGLRVTHIDTARLVPLCDAYIAFGSATIRWAISCGIPTINYDVFNYDYSDFKNVGGVLNVSDYGAFGKACHLLRRGTPELASLAANAQAEAGRWGTLDGKSVDRIVALIDELCAVKPVPRTAA